MGSSELVTEIVGRSEVAAVDHDSFVECMGRCKGLYHLFVDRDGAAEGGGWSAECGVRSAECGVRSAEGGGSSAECGVRRVEGKDGAVKVDGVRVDG